MRALATNKLASSPYYQKILHLYNEEYIRTGGKMNNLKFYREVILPILPNYHAQSWYQFLRRFKTTAGLVAVRVVNGGPRPLAGIEENVLQDNLLSNEVATQLGIQRALNIGAGRLKEILDNPQLMTAKDAIELLFKAMRAQDSRIQAVSKIREDTRKQTAFEQAFLNAVCFD